MLNIYLSYDMSISPIIDTVVVMVNETINTSWVLHPRIRFPEVIVNYL